MATSIPRPTPTPVPDTLTALTEILRRGGMNVTVVR